MMTKGNEHLHDEVYGKTFNLYTKKEIEEFIVPFETRFKKNNISPQNIFDGKKCLDAGCGGGRGSIFMAKNGAKQIEAVDLSDTNINTTIENAKKFNFDNINVQKESLDNLPYPDEYFDVVWCNGVLMHTHDPDACLKEISRVLKIGGKAWVYVYGSGGTYWHCVDLYRNFLKSLPTEDCINTLQFLGNTASHIAEYIDDWKAPYLRAYTNLDFSTRLRSLGFDADAPLPYGTTYDTSERKTRFSNEADLIGEGDLRYLIEKKAHHQNDDNKISDSVWGSEYQIHYKGFEKINEKFNALNTLLDKKESIYKLATFSRLQRYLRDELFNKTTTFSLENYLSFINQVIKEASLLK